MDKIKIDTISGMQLKPFVVTKSIFLEARVYATSVQDACDIADYFIEKKTILTANEVESHDKKLKEVV